MIIPEEAIPYIHLQVGGIDKNRLPDSYFEYIQFASRTARALLPKSANHIVDIGGGLSGASMLLALATGATLHIVDGDESDGIPEHKCQDKPFNSFAVTERFLNANGLPSDRIRFHHLTVDALPNPVDMIVSFASWGFHFPLDRYLPAIHHLPIGGAMVIDLREQKNEI